MNISTLQENLKNGLYVVSHIAGKNVNLPILNNIKIEARDGNIELTATDLEIGISCKVRGKVEKEGVYTVESKLLTDYISLLPNQQVNIEKKENNLFIESENYKTSIKGQSAEDYPLIPEVPKNNYYKAGFEDFKKALSQVIFAVSQSENRSELAGVFFRFSKDRLVLAATDSHRLAEKSIKISTNIKEVEPDEETELGADQKTIIPAKTLQELLRILSAVKAEDLSAGSSEISFFLTDNQIMFQIGSTELVSRLIEGQYPEYTQILPDNIETNITIDRTEFIRAVKAASLFSKTGINDVNLDFPLGKNKAIITSTSGHTGENTAEIDAEINGKDNGIVINYRFLLDGLNNINSKNIKIEMTDCNTPCILRPDNDKDYLYLIMPIKQ